MLRISAFVLSVLTSLSQPCFARPCPYPASWWAYVEPGSAPAWEILPQAGKCESNTVILSKRHELGILSNFSETPFSFEGKKYKSIEGFWQMMKYPESADDPRLGRGGVVWPHTRDEVAQMVGFAAKEAGNIASKNMQQLGINWVSFNGKTFPYHTPEKGEHYRLIAAAMWEKVSQNPKVKDVLLRTGSLKLLPDHVQEANASPAWKYFEIYEGIRTQLRTE